MLAVDSTASSDLACASMERDIKAGVPRPLYSLASGSMLPAIVQARWFPHYAHTAHLWGHDGLPSAVSLASIIPLAASLVGNVHLVRHVPLQSPKTFAAAWLVAYLLKVYDHNNVQYSTVVPVCDGAAATWSHDTTQFLVRDFAFLTLFTPAVMRAKGGRSTGTRFPSGNSVGTTPCMFFLFLGENAKCIE